MVPGATGWYSRYVSSGVDEVNSSKSRKVYLDSRERVWHGVVWVVDVRGRFEWRDSGLGGRLVRLGARFGSSAKWWAKVWGRSGMLEARTVCARTRS